MRYIKRLPEVFSLLEAFLFVSVFPRLFFSKKIFFQCAKQVLVADGDDGRVYKTEQGDDHVKEHNFSHP